MTLQTCVAKGNGRIRTEGLRCAAKRPDDSSRVCNKLLLKPNTQGQMAGNFRCDRCGQEIELVLKVLTEGVQTVA